jgi:hypothetical protein
MQAVRAAREDDGFATIAARAQSEAANHSIVGLASNDHGDLWGMGMDAATIRARLFVGEASHDAWTAQAKLRMRGNRSDQVMTAPENRGVPRPSRRP